LRAFALQARAERLQAVVARSRLALKLRVAAGRLVRLALREDRLLFGNPEYLRYNAQANALAAAHPGCLRPSHSPPHRAHEHVCAGADDHGRAAARSAARCRGPRTREHRPTRLRRIFLLLLVNALLFSVLGGALLTRYLLPMYPLVLLLAVTTLYRRVPYWQGLAVLSAAAFVAGLFVNPPYGFAPEDNLEYARVVRMQLSGIAQLEHRYPGAAVLTAWPMTDELTRPELGYVKRPWDPGDVDRIDDFSAAQIAKAAAEPEKYSAALVFSTKYDPPSPLLTLGAKSKQLDERYFGMHHDLPPELIAQQLGGALVWERKDHGMWIALIRFDRQLETHLDGGSGQQRAMR
jgi:hypothetical protein